MDERDTLAVPDYSSPLTEQDSWWDAEADDVEGYDLLKDAAQFSLVGVPFRISRLIYRQGIQSKGIPWRNDYVTAEVRVAPAPVIIKAWDRIMTRRTGKLITDARNIPTPGEQLVLNDGSTGIYRQSVEYLEAKELITVPDDLPKTGGKNECRYDLPASMWSLSETVQPSRIEVRYTPTGEQVTLFNVDLRCSRGLRYSDYENEFTDDEGAITWYIA